MNESNDDGTTAGPSTSRISDEQVALILGAINKSQAEMQSLWWEMQEEAGAKMKAMRREAAHI